MSWPFILARFRTALVIADTSCGSIFLIAIHQQMRFQSSGNNAVDRRVERSEAYGTLYVVKPQRPFDLANEHGTNRAAIGFPATKALCTWRRSLAVASQSLQRPLDNDVLNADQCDPGAIL